MNTVKQQFQSDTDPLLKVQEVAKRLSLSTSAVYNLISRGSIPYVNLASGRKRVPRVRQSDAEEFIRRRLTPAEAKP